MPKANAVKICGFFDGPRGERLGEFGTLRGLEPRNGGELHHFSRY